MMHSTEPKRDRFIDTGQTIGDRTTVAAEVIFNAEALEMNFIATERATHALMGATLMATNEAERSFLNFLIATCEEYIH